MLRVLKAFFPALILTYLLASSLATHSVMQSLREMGVAVSVQTQIAATWHDLLGMSSSYLLLICVAMLVALPSAAGLVRLLGGRRVPLFVLAGFVAMLVLHLSLQALLQVTPLAVARSLPGLLSQCLAGAVGAWLYASLSSTRRAAG